MKAHTKQQQDTVFQMDFIDSQKSDPPFAHLLALSQLQKEIFSPFTFSMFYYMYIYFEIVFIAVSVYIHIYLCMPCLVLLATLKFFSIRIIIIGNQQLTAGESNNRKALGKCTR